MAGKRLVLVFALAGCTATPAPGPAQAPSEPSLDSSSDPRPFAGAIPAACMGAKVDLSMLSGCACTGQKRFVRDGKHYLRAGGWCGPEHDGDALPVGIEASLTATEPRVAPGATTSLVFRIRNKTATERAVLVTDRNFARYLDVLDAKGTVVTTTGKCASGMSSSHKDHLVVLAPGGEASVVVPWQAASDHGEEAAGECAVTRRPYAPGRYQVRMRAPLSGEPLLLAPIEVGGA